MFQKYNSCCYVENVEKEGWKHKDQLEAATVDCIGLNQFTGG